MWAARVYWQCLTGIDKISMSLHSNRYCPYLQDMGTFICFRTLCKNALAWLHFISNNLYVIYYIGNGMLVWKCRHCTYLGTTYSIYWQGSKRLGPLPWKRYCWLVSVSEILKAFYTSTWKLHVQSTTSILSCSIEVWLKLIWGKTGGERNKEKPHYFSKD